MTTQQLPPHAVMRRGRMFRRVTLPNPNLDGKPAYDYKPVASTLEEAKAKRWDFYHPEFGWILEGYKLAGDRTVNDRLRDSTGVNFVGNEQLDVFDDDEAPDLEDEV